MQAVTAASGVLPEEALRAEAATQEAGIAAGLERQLRLQAEAQTVEAAAAGEHVQPGSADVTGGCGNKESIASRSRSLCFHLAVHREADHPRAQIYWCILALSARRADSGGRSNSADD